jgi:hypothetical protein
MRFITRPLLVTAILGLEGCASTAPVAIGGDTPGLAPAAETASKIAGYCGSYRTATVDGDRILNVKPNAVKIKLVNCTRIFRGRVRSLGVIRPACRFNTKTFAQLL